MINRILDRARAEMFDLKLHKSSFHKGFNDGVHTVMKIVQEVARDGGWIPVEERLPEYDWYSTVCWVTLKNKFGLVCTRKMRWCGNGRWIWVNGHDLGSEWEVIAWKPYEAPAPYQKGE